MDKRTQEDHFGPHRPKIPCIHAVARGVAPVIFLAVTGFLVVGCSEVARYRVLSFFFDGVPPPEGVAETEPQEITGPSPVYVPRTGRGVEMPAEEAPATRPAAPRRTPRMLSVHAPYRDRLCFECHSPESSYEILGTEAEVCRKCHGQYFEFRGADWVHGPVAVGECAVCHVPHQSEHLGLQTASQPDLCFRCHEAAAVVGRSYHGAIEDQLCSTCHDPHVAGNRLLLADSRTYRRRNYAARPAQSTHAAWEKEDCTRCHVPERSYELREDVNEVCLLCHGEAGRAAPGERLHDAVRQGECMVCHTPHRSPLPHLIKPSGEAICYECHDPDELRTSDHPRVYQVDCLLCHTGHSSERDHLLKAGILLTN